MNDVVEVRYVRDYYDLNTISSYGTSGDIDLRESLRGPVFEPLHDMEYFKRVSVDPKIGQARRGCFA